MIREANPVGAALDELTKDNPLLGLIMSHVKLPEIEVHSDLAKIAKKFIVSWILADILAKSVRILTKNTTNLPAYIPGYPYPQITTQNLLSSDLAKRLP